MIDGGMYDSGIDELAHRIAQYSYPFPAIRATALHLNQICEAPEQLNKRFSTNCE